LPTAARGADVSPGHDVKLPKQTTYDDNNASYFGNYSAAQTIELIGILLGVTLMFYWKKNFGPQVGQN